MEIFESQRNSGLRHARGATAQRHNRNIAPRGESTEIARRYLTEKVFLYGAPPCARIRLQRG